VTTDPDAMDPTSATNDGPAAAAPESGPGTSGDPSAGAPREETDPPGIREQIGAVVAAARRLVSAHVELARAEIGEITGEVARAAALGCLAAAVVLFALLLLTIGLILFLGEWIFGSIGWGVLLGTLLLVDIAVLAGLLVAGVPGGRLGRVLLLALAVGVVVGLVLGLDLTNRAWTAAGDSLLPSVDAGFRPLAIAVMSLAVIGAILGLVVGIRAAWGSGGSGLVVGAATGIILGSLTAVALGPRVGAAFGVLATLLAWPAFAGLVVARAGLDVDALKVRFYPGQTIETTKETIEWLRQRTPLGPKP
jgi:hypothetical protein